MWPTVKTIHAIRDSCSQNFLHYGKKNMLLEVAIYCFVKPKIIFWSMHHFFRFVCFFVEITMRAQCGCDSFYFFVDLRLKISSSYKSWYVRAECDLRDILVDLLFVRKSVFINNLFKSIEIILCKSWVWSLWHFGGFAFQTNLPPPSFALRTFSRPTIIWSDPIRS